MILDTKRVQNDFRNAGACPEVRRVAGLSWALLQDRQQLSLLLLVQ
jgi:hypothetical protein